MIKKSIFFIALSFLLLLGCKGEPKENVGQDEKIVDKSSEQWTMLFDGKTFNGWHTYLSDTISDQWQIENGEMYYKPDPNKNQGMNNLITDKKYKSFILSLEWKISVDGNSGVFYGVFEDEKFVVPYMTAPEIQIRDYTNMLDFNDKKQMSGAIFGIVAVPEDASKPAGEWNHFIIKVDHKNNQGAVTLNDKELYTFPVHGDQWKQLVASSKFKDWEGFGITKEGGIGLQDHAHGVWFRDIKIQELE